MKETLSPFAALTTKERLEQWNYWHSQHQTEIEVQQKPTDADVRSESVLHNAKPTESREMLQAHHSQYDAVINRIRKACCGTGVFHSCTVDNTKQDGSGKP